ncbi:MAG: membrane lipoprotein lipid attachment site-containing protein [Spirochaetaceae bacterium]|nr:membrane lipoprotein lipid attachment site-containing protein [Spirochaetaceae bacterium]MBR4790547.1 membrane lipoprotein lipid attachment site-containing protein [Treponema sp.]
MKKYFVILFIVFLLTSCKSIKNDECYGYQYGNPLCISDEELQEAKEKVNQGQLSYCNIIANHYESLQEPDIAKVIYWLTIGAERGEPSCMWYLGYEFYEIYDDKEIGLYWIKKAASLGEENAIDFLEDM